MYCSPFTARVWPAAALGSLLVAAAHAATPLTFVFGTDKAPPGCIAVAADTLYSDEQGYGFERDNNLPAPGLPAMPATAPAIQAMERSDGPLVSSSRSFIFSVKLPEGNYKVTLTLGDGQDESTTTVKAEARRLMLERIHTAKGEHVTRSFTVNIRRPGISGAVPVKLDPREPGSFTWDEKLSLQFSDVRPTVASLEIVPADHALTLFLCGDSTVTDQPREPYDAWGQMLPRFFTSDVAVANHAESGQTLKAFRLEHRWDKVLSQLKPGDYVFLQFGHNDLNRSGRNALWPPGDPSGDWSVTFSEANGDYKTLLKEYVSQVRQKGATPVIISPMTKLDIRTGQLNIGGLRDYPKAAVEAAREADAACIDLNAMSIRLMESLGPDHARRAYVDGLHTNAYGAYLLARCVVEGIRQNKLPLAQFLAADAGSFDFDHPQPPPDAFALPLEPSPLPGWRSRPATAPAASRPE